ncbi:NAD(P)-dependent oxidoreductase [Castellaniella sp. MT123]|uniref:precorrin-2 dehydrogenase/sirohydrochlorin ferrochelatase family protein n=1 Tax=Castellaniella sp. MT123 TaxID=3140381 RepID=UPI0031F35E5A
MKPLYPLFADLVGRDVLVVGGGAVAERKVRSLRDSGARIRVAAIRLNTRLREWCAEGHLTHLPGPFDPQWLDDAWLVIAATNDRPLNARIREAADARRIFSNVVDDPVLSSFQVPAILNHAPLVIAISTAGTAPVLARRLRTHLEPLVDPVLGTLARLAGEHRQAIRQAYPDIGARRRFFDGLIDGPVLALLRHGDTALAARTLLDQLSGKAAAACPPPRITWVHPCPIDPELLTLKALRAMNHADLILHTLGIPASLLSLSRKDADRALLDDDIGETNPGVRDALIRDRYPTHRDIVVLAG